MEVKMPHGAIVGPVRRECACCTRPAPTWLFVLQDGSSDWICMACREPEKEKER